MGPSKVYFTDMRALPGTNLQQKLKRLILKAGIGQIDFQDKYAAIKIHFGEPGNLSYLRPNFAKTVADAVKELGGRPFLTDCNTLYVGRRKNALDHIEAAYENGFSPFSTGCQIIIADGLKGTDEVDVPVRGGEYIREAHIGRAVMDADIFISLSHFKGHESTGFGGAIKNIGMGCGSRAGKMDMHSASGPKVKTDKCVGCGRCLAVCPKDAISADYADSVAMLNYKMAEYSLAVCQNRPCFHVSLICDVSPNCDCHGENDAPILPNIGMFASFDPLALDQACVDACLAATPLPNSQLAENMKKADFVDHHDHFRNSTPESEWRSCLDHAEKIGLGSRSYELIEV